MNPSKNKQILTPLIHLMAWGLFFSIPFFTFWRDSYGDTGLKLLHNGVTLVSLLTVFYLNFFILTEKLLFRHKIGEYVMYNVLLVLTMGYLVHLCKEALPQIHFDHRRMPPPDGFSPMIMLFFKDIFPLLITLALSIAVKMTGKWYELEMRNQEGEKRRTEAELLNLRQQLNPHFLFNTLNNIYALIAISPDKAQTVVHDLSKLLRYVLYENNDEKVLLSHELEFIVNYVELMRIRLTSDVEVRMKVESVNDRGLEIAPMLFITLVENAFKHGISPNKHSVVDIDIHTTEDKKVMCRIQNSLFPKDETDRSGSGIGLENLRRRLAILYPDKHTMTNTIDNDMYRFELIIEL